MILADYLRSERDLTWDIALQCGVRHGVIRLPEDESFDITDPSHWETVHKRFTDFGIKPIIIEPMPNSLHDHIKAGDARRDECIERVRGMFPIMRSLGIGTICFNWMAHIGWLRTRSDFEERGGAKVTAFDLDDFKPTGAVIGADELWKNYEYFINAVIDDAEKYEIKLALHPDDPPIEKLGGVSRIMISRENIRRAIFDIRPSESLGLTLCQANFFIMGEDLLSVAKEFSDKIHFIHFRNTRGVPTSFRETFHDNGDIDMAKVLNTYTRLGINVPIRVDHVPTMRGEISTLPGYDALGRLFAIGYLKGILDSINDFGGNEK